MYRYCLKIFLENFVFVARDTGSIYVGFHVSATCLILMKMRMCPHIFVTVRNNKFREGFFGVSAHVYRQAERF